TKPWPTEGAPKIATEPGTDLSTLPDDCSSTSSVPAVPSGAELSTKSTSPAAAAGAMTYPGVTCFQSVCPVDGSKAITEPVSPCGVRPPAAKSRPPAETGVEMEPQPKVGSPTTSGSAGSMTASWYFHTGPLASESRRRT